MIRLHSFYIVLTQSKGGGDLWERKPGRGPGRHYKSSTSPENLSLHNGRPAQVMWILLWWYQKNAAISLSGWNAFGVEEYSKSTCVVHVKQNLLKRKMLVEIAKLKSTCRKKGQKEKRSAFEKLKKVINIKQFDQLCEINRTNWGPKKRTFS